MAKNCGFCGKPGMTKEHLWSDWMRKVILESRAAGGQKLFEAEIERGGEAKRYKNPTLEQMVGMPCDRCNSGWMSALENGIKDFMRPMIFRGERVLLSRERQVALSRWAIKTAMVYEFTSAREEGKYFSDAERLAFKERFELPENVWVWTGRYDGIRPMHAVLRRAPKGPQAPIMHSLTFSAKLPGAAGVRLSCVGWGPLASCSRDKDGEVAPGVAGFGLAVMATEYDHRRRCSWSA
jgi:hypothetical protein